MATTPQQDAIASKLLTSLGFNPQNMSSTEWLQFAIDCEQTAKDCGPFDPVYEHFINQSMNALRAAEIQENAGN